MELYWLIVFAVREDAFSARIVRRSVKTNKRRAVVKRRFVNFAGVMLLALITMPAVSGQAAEAAKDGSPEAARVRRPLDVNVVNAPSVNVANTPTVTVGNTPSVNVANTPSVQVLGTPSVTVASSDSAPVVTRQAKAPEPFTVQFAPASPVTKGLLPGTTSSGEPVKTVVIEFVNASCEAPTGTTMPGVAAFTFFFGGNPVFYVFQPGAPLQFSTSAVFITSERTLIFADPASTGIYNLTLAPAKCNATLSGYLIPA
jgi:hypothetical protein